MNTYPWSTEYLYDCTQPYIPKVELENSSHLMTSSVSSFYSTSPSASPDFIYNTDTLSFPMHVGSPDSFITGPVYPPQLVQSSSTSTTASAYLNETIAKASALPESFYPEFLQYSKESFEQPNNKKRSRSVEQSSSEEDEDERASRIQKTEEKQDVSISEIRRQIHIQSEQKRRAQIKDGFEELRTELPSCLNKKMSKVTLLHKTVQHIQHLKSTQATILAELERLVQENEQLRKVTEFSRIYAQQRVA